MKSNVCNPARVDCGFLATTAARQQRLMNCLRRHLQDLLVLRSMNFPFVGQLLGRCCLREETRSWRARGFVNPAQGLYECREARACLPICPSCRV